MQLKWAVGYWLKVQKPFEICCKKEVMIYQMTHVCHFDTYDDETIHSDYK